MPAHFFSLFQSLPEHRSAQASQIHTIISFYAERTQVGRLATCKAGLQLFIMKVEITTTTVQRHMGSRCERSPLQEREPGDRRV